MVYFSKLSIAALALCGQAAVAHPGETHSDEHMAREIRVRDHVASVGQRSLNTCSSSPAAQALKARSIDRRAEKVRELRAKRGIKTCEPNT